MTDKHGDFVWYELMTTDAGTAQEFYSGLLGWTWSDSGQEHIDYRMFSTGDAPVGGLMALTAEMVSGGARPGWLGYLLVDNVPAALDGIRKHGGSVMMEGMEVPGVGPFAMVADCCGVPLYIIDDQSGDPSHAFSKHEPRVGTCAWNELVTDDPDAADRFYREIFGWEKGDALDMGPMGLYQMYNHGDYGLGAIMKRPDEMPASFWSFYFRVPEIDAAKSYVESHGGQIINGPMEIPGGDRVFQGIDPQGAVFSLIGK